MKVRHFTTEKIVTQYHGAAPTEELVTTFLTEDGDLWQYRFGRWLCINEPSKVTFIPVDPAQSGVHGKLASDSTAAAESNLKHER